MALRRPLDPEKKERLLKAARKEFAAKGYELASLNTILDEAGFSKGSFYWYFEDKADLAVTVVREETDAAFAPFKALRLPDTVAEFWAELRRLSMGRLQSIESDRERYESLIRIGNAVLGDPKLYARMSPEIGEGRKMLGAFLERGVAIGAMRSDVPIGTLMGLLESVKTTLYKSMYPGDRVPTQAQMESFTDLLIDFAQRIFSR
ncbi:MAG: TetR/AcrR family transcriptional regulator [Archangiaceae bacterium]|nr:TetR/AcrR family transcriptional regulator [Archangiaceae bacterium]